MNAVYSWIVTIISVASMMRTRMLNIFVFFYCFHVMPLLLCAFWFPFYFSLSCVHRLHTNVLWTSQLYVIPVWFATQFSFTSAHYFRFVYPFSFVEKVQHFLLRSILQFLYCHCNFHNFFCLLLLLSNELECIWMEEKSKKPTTTFNVAWEKSNYFALFLSCFSLALLDFFCCLFSHTFLLSIIWNNDLSTHVCLR